MIKDTVAVKPCEVELLVHSLRFAAQHQPHLKRTRRWRLAMLANALERRAR